MIDRCGCEVQASPPPPQPPPLASHLCFFFSKDSSTAKHLQLDRSTLHYIGRTPKTVVSQSKISGVPRMKKGALQTNSNLKQSYIYFFQLSRCFSLKLCAKSPQNPLTSTKIWQCFILDSRTVLSGYVFPWTTAACFGLFAMFRAYGAVLYAGDRMARMKGILKGNP